MRQPITTYEIDRDTWEEITGDDGHDLHEFETDTGIWVRLPNADLDEFLAVLEEMVDNQGILSLSDVRTMVEEKVNDDGTRDYIFIGLSVEEPDEDEDEDYDEEDEDDSDDDEQEATAPLTEPVGLRVVANAF